MTNILPEILHRRLVELSTMSDGSTPVMFRTCMTEAILASAEALVAADAIPMKRIGKPGELAPAVLFLASEGASYITGEVIAVDEGRTAQEQNFLSNLPAQLTACIASERKMVAAPALLRRSDSR